MNSTPPTPDTYSIGNYHHLRSAFLTLHILGGYIGLPILVAVFVCCKSISRPATLINFCVSWIVFSVFYCISLLDELRGGRLPDETDTVCLAQAVLVYGAPPMAAVAGLVEVIHLWSRLGDPTNKRLMYIEWLVNNSPLRFVMFAMPYIVFLAFTLTSGLVVHKSPQSVRFENGLYCAIGDSRLSIGVPLFCTIILVFILSFEVSIVLRRYQSWRELKTLSPLAKQDHVPTMVFRVGIFTVYSIITLSAGVYFLSNTAGPWPFMVQAALPLTALLVFGVHSDVGDLLCFRKPTPLKRQTSDETLEAALERLGCMSTLTLPSLEQSV